MPRTRTGPSLSTLTIATTVLSGGALAAWSPPTTASAPGTRRLRCCRLGGLLRRPARGVGDDALAPAAPALSARRGRRPQPRPQPAAARCRQRAGLHLPVPWQLRERRHRPLEPVHHHRLPGQHRRGRLGRADRRQGGGRSGLRRDRAEVLLPRGRPRWCPVPARRRTPPGHSWCSLGPSPGRAPCCRRRRRAASPRRARAVPAWTLAKDAKGRTWGRIVKGYVVLNSTMPLAHGFGDRPDVRLAGHPRAAGDARARPRARAGAYPDVAAGQGADHVSGADAQDGRLGRRRPHSSEGAGSHQRVPLDPVSPGPAADRLGLRRPSPSALCAAESASGGGAGPGSPTAGTKWCGGGVVHSGAAPRPVYTAVLSAGPVAARRRVVLCSTSRPRGQPCRQPFTTAAARSVGLSRDVLARGVRRGLLVRLAHGSYVLAAGVGRRRAARSAPAARGRGVEPAAGRVRDPPQRGAAARPADADRLPAVRLADHRPDPPDQRGDARPTGCATPPCRLEHVTQP